MNFLALMWVSTFAQAIDLSGFADILFLFIGLGQIALAIAIGLAVLLAVLDLIGLDVLGLIRSVKGGR